MLSKVLSRADAGTVQPLVFRDLAGYKPGADIRETSGSIRGPDSPVRDRPDSGENDANAALREKLRQLVSQTAAERQEAFEAGKQQGRQEARTELQPVLDRLNASVTQVLGMRSDLRGRAERDAVQLALMIAKRVLHRQLSVDESALTAIAHIAFDRLTRSESWRVTVHPQFAAAVTAALPGSHATRVHVDPDPDCALGTLIIHSAEGTIDASVDAQLEEISRGLTDRLANS
jgi:flagellar assembly protein FliH